MLQQTKTDLTVKARTLAQPYEAYTIDELADAYCDAVDTNNTELKDVYISALILRFWYVIDKLYKNNTVAPCLEYEDFFWWLYEGIEYACKYRGWRDPNKKLNARQCINQCINTIKLQKYYDLRLDKHKAANFCYSLDTPLGGEDSEGKTIGETIEDEFNLEDSSTADAIILIQKYIDKNKVIEAIMLDNIAFNDVQKHFKKTIKATTADGVPIRYTEHSSEFWPYKLIQEVGHLPKDYAASFLKRYKISEEKLFAVLNVINNANNQKLYKYLRFLLNDLRKSYSY